jgi:hypothetical protein
MYILGKNRKKLYADPTAYEGAKEKDRMRKQLKRVRIKLAGGQKARQARLKAGLYQQRLRKKIQSTKHTPTDEVQVSTAFVTPQSMGKAVKRVENVMPKSPGRRVTIMGKMISQLSPKKIKLVVKLPMIPK